MQPQDYKGDPAEAATVLKTTKEEQGSHCEYFVAPLMLSRGLI